MQNIITSGVILRRTNYAEADRILEIYTEKLGKVSAIAKGSRKLSSKKSGHLELGNTVSFDLIPGKNMYIVAGAKIQTRYDFVNLKQMNALFLWLELIGNLIHENDPCPKTFDLVAMGLAAACEIESGPMKMAMVELKLFDNLGYRLNLDGCIEGSEPLDENKSYFLSMHKGGLTCDLHRDENDSISVSAQLIKLLRLVHFGNWDILMKLKEDPELLLGAENLVRIQRHYIVGKKLKAEG